MEVRNRPPKVCLHLLPSTCHHAQWSCVDEPCPGTCLVYGNGHYQTFDSKWYRYDGNCQYTLVEVSQRRQSDITFSLGYQALFFILLGMFVLFSILYCWEINSTASSKKTSTILLFSSFSHRMAVVVKLGRFLSKWRVSRAVTRLWPVPGPSC